MCALLPLEIFMDCLQLWIGIEIVTVLCVEKPAVSCQHNEIFWQTACSSTNSHWSLNHKGISCRGATILRLRQITCLWTNSLWNFRRRMIPVPRGVIKKSFDPNSLSQERTLWDEGLFEFQWKRLETNKHTRPLKWGKNKSGELLSETHTPVVIFSVILSHYAYHRVSWNRCLVEICFTEDQTRFLRRSVSSATAF